MPWTRQVWQVFRKDVVRQRWLLLSFVLCAIGSMAIMLQRSVSQDAYDAAHWDSMSLPVILWMFLPLLAALLVAVTIIDDAPTEPRAHWATLPLDRSAVISAKLLLLLGVVPLIVGVALTTMHLTFGVHVGDLPALLFTGLRTLIVLIMIALPIAAIVRDLRSFLLAVMALLAFVLLLLETMQWNHAQLSFSSPVLRVSVALLLVLGAAGIAWRLYVTRRRSWPMYAAVGVLGLLNSAYGVMTPAPDAVLASASFPDARISSTLQRISSETSDTRSFAWQLNTTGLPPDLQVVLRAGDATATVDASCEPLIEFNGHATALQYPALPLGGTVRWRGTPPHFSRRFTSVLTQRWTPTANAPGCTPNVQAVLDVSEPRLIGRIPLETGASLTRDGYRLSVRSAGIETGGWIARLHVASSVSQPSVNRPMPADLTYVLRHEARGDAILLETGTQSGSMQRPISRSRMVLFPARPRVEPTGERVPRPSRMVGGTAEWLRETWKHYGFESNDDAERWLRGTELLVFRWDHRAMIPVNPQLAEDVR